MNEMKYFGMFSSFFNDILLVVSKIIDAMSDKIELAVQLQDKTVLGKDIT